jgi:hypothetical protein
LVVHFSGARLRAAAREPRPKHFFSGYVTIYYVYATSSGSPHRSPYTDT